MSRSRVLWAVWSVGLLTLGASSALRASEVVVVDNLTDFGETSYYSGVGYPGPTNSIVNESALQRFDAPIGGQLTTITTRGGKFSSAGEVPLKVWILGVAGTLPGAPLGMLTVPSSQLEQSTAAETTFDFSALNVELEAGHGYFVAFTVDTPGDRGTGSRYGFRHVWTPAHALGYHPLTGRDGLQGTYIGEGPSSSPVGEIALRVKVVPEPQTLMGGLMMGCFALRRRRLR